MLLQPSTPMCLLQHLTYPNYTTMSCEQGRVHHVGHGRGRSCLPTTHVTKEYWAMYDNVIPTHIWSQVNKLEAKEVHQERNTHWALRNLLSHRLLTEERESSKATSWIVELFVNNSHITSSLHCLSHNVGISFPPDIPSSSYHGPSTFVFFPLGSSSPSTIFENDGHPSPARRKQETLAHLENIQVTASKLSPPHPSLHSCYIIEELLADAINVPTQRQKFSTVIGQRSSWRLWC